MGEKVWGGVLLGVFVAAVGIEIARRKCPDMGKSLSESTKKIFGTAENKIKDFTSTASSAFKEGYDFVKT